MKIVSKKIESYHKLKKNICKHWLAFLYILMELYVVNNANFEDRNITSPRLRVYVILSIRSHNKFLLNIIRQFGDFYNLMNVKYLL